MKKLTVLALFSLVVLVTAPLAAAETPAVSIETPTAQVAAPAQTTAPTPPANTAVVPGALPFAPVNLTCSGNCFSEYSSCKLDCRFQPYTGCANDCWLAYQACLGGC